MQKAWFAFTAFNILWHMFVIHQLGQESRMYGISVQLLIMSFGGKRYVDTICVSTLTSLPLC